MLSYKMLRSVLTINKVRCAVWRVLAFRRNSIQEYSYLRNQLLLDIEN